MQSLDLINCYQMWLIWVPEHHGLEGCEKANKNKYSELS